MNYELSQATKTIRYHVTVAVILIATVIFGSGLALFPVSVHGASSQTLIAQYGLDTAANTAGLKAEASLGATVGDIIQGILGFIGVVLMLLIIYAGFLWMTAAGNEEKVATAKRILSSAVIGFILVFLSYAITLFITENFFPTATLPNQPPAAVCGNGVVEQGEACDDGNTTSGDGCSATCLVET